VPDLSRRAVGSGHTKLIVGLPLEIEKSVSDRDALSLVARHGLTVFRNDDAGDLFTVEYLHRTLEQPFLGKGGLGFENLQDSLQIRASRVIVDIRYADLLVDGELKMLDLGGEIEGRLWVNGVRRWRRRIFRGVNGIGNGCKEAFLFGSLSSTVLPFIAKLTGDNMSISMSSLGGFYLTGAIVILLARIFYLRRDLVSS
jgi:hypothetical protein